MKEEDIKRMIRFVSILGFLLLFLVLSSIGVVLMLQYQPDLVQGWLAKEKSRNSEQINEAFQDEWTPEKLEEVGLVEGEGLQLVLANCTNCHSAKLVTQNRFTREGWIQVIRWMQETQGFWELGENEDAIVDYLSTHFAPEAQGRRMPLEVEWYSLE
ncbi:cytochrome C [Belliella sp. DSM 107340]|uniref:Cytochrome C n=1 Tax=Belliella calami TaxID=2923436 RepID=A0ABS9UQG2_9BACT|nr:cytochrome C [Belliella calami]MCH7398773.1 cytochrome C [Belliella calami]